MKRHSNLIFKSLVVAGRLTKILSLSAPAALVVGFLLLPTCVVAQIGAMDEPQEQDVVSGTWTFSGWWMDSQAAIGSVGVFIDGTNFGAASYGGSRPDVCSLVGNYPGCPNVGWSMSFDTTVLVNGPHFLKITATTTDGRQASIVRAFVADNAGLGLDNQTYYEIVNRATGKALDVNQANPASGALLIDQSFGNGANQLWSVVSTPSGHYVFEALSSSKALSVPYGSSSSGTQTQQFEAYGGAEQEWILIASGNGYYAFFNSANGLALDLQGGSLADGTPTVISSYYAGTTQQWALVPVLNPPSGLFGTGGSEGQNSAPYIDPSDLLFNPASINPMGFSNAANGPVCDSAGELAQIPTLFVPASAADGISHVTYAYTDPSGVYSRKPKASVASAIDGAFKEWNVYTTTTFVSFDYSSIASAAKIHVFKGNNDQATYCASFIPTTSGLGYSVTFEQTAAASPQSAQGIAAHEVGHTLGLDEAVSRPGTPTIMNQSSGGNLQDTCLHPESYVDTLKVLSSDASKANTCISTARSQQGSSGGYQVAYSTVTYNDGYCTYYLNTIDWYLDDSFTGSDSILGSINCP